MLSEAGELLKKFALFKSQKTENHDFLKYIRPKLLNQNFPKKKFQHIDKKFILKAGLISLSAS